MAYRELSSNERRSGTAVAQTERKSRARLILIAVAAIGAGAYLATQYDWSGSIASLTGGDRPTRARTQPPPPVHTASATTQDVQVRITTIGSVLANSVVTVRSQVDGPLLSTAFKEGQMVKKGDLLFRIDPAPFEAALRQAEAQEARDRATLVSVQADANRAVMLAERGIVSTQQRDQLVAQMNALSATILADVANVDRAKLNLGYTAIRSPINGKTGPFMAFPGNQIRANDTAGLVTITEIQPVKIAFNIAQGELPRLQNRLNEKNLVASVSVRSELNSGSSNSVPASDRDIAVKIDFIGNIVDSRSGTIELRSTFDNPDLRFVPGELVDVSVVLETLRQTVTVPREAVNIGQNGEYVFVVGDDNKAQMRPIEVLYQDQTLAAIGKGVEKGEHVIVDGQLLVSPGLTVAILPPAGPRTTVAEGTSQDNAGTPRSRP